VVIPALAQLEYDRRVGVLDDERVEFALQTVREFLAQPADSDAADSASKDAADDAGRSAAGDAAGPLILVVLDRGSFDSLAPLMISRVVEPEPWRLEVLSKDSLSTDVVEQVRARQPAAVLLVAIEPRDSARIRHICARLLVDERSKPVHVAIFGLREREVAIRFRQVTARSAELHATLSSTVDALRRIAARTMPESSGAQPQGELPASGALLPVS
jgi:hypothetical protein